MNLVEKAKIFAFKAHGEQKRKYSDEPYTNHLLEVVGLLTLLTETTETMFAAAWLHDTVEDCNISLAEIILNFGTEVAALVGSLTDVSTLEDGDRKTRKELDRQHSALGSPNAKTIKLADLISNSYNIINSKHPDAIAFAKIYITEKKALLEVLQEGNQYLYNLAKVIVESYKEQ